MTVSLVIGLILVVGALFLIIRSRQKERGRLDHLHISGDDGG